VLNILIIEANQKLKKPYQYLSPAYQTVRLSTIEKAGAIFLNFKPELIFLSCSFSPQQIITFLDCVANECRPHLIPIIFVIDLNHPLNFIPGTHWGQQTAVFSEFTSKHEFYTTLDRLLNY